MYESKHEPLLAIVKFYRRLLAHVLAALLLIAVTLLVGMLAHLWLEPVSWHDALLNTALIVSGIGPYIMPASVAGKLFLAAYSTLVSLIFVAMLGLILAPIAHRIAHKFHLDDD